MKNFLNRLIISVWDLLEAMGKARAAAELSRSGKYEEAKRIVSRD